MTTPTDLIPERFFFSASELRILFVPFEFIKNGRKLGMDGTMHSFQLNLLLFLSRLFLRYSDW